VSEPSAIPVWLAAAFAVALGGVVGSFLNVVIARVPAGLSIVRPRSRCPRCLAPIAWYDNVPMLSWLLLRGRCRACRAAVSWRYPVVEALGAAAALAAYARHGPSAAAVAELVFVAALLALAFIDLDTWLLPHALTWPLIALGLGAGAVGLTPAGSLRASAYGAGVGFAIFAVIAVAGERVFKREALGFGDVWLLAGLGAWLGLGALLPLVLLASLQGTGVGLALIAAGRGQPGPSTPTSTVAPTPTAAPTAASTPTPTSTPAGDDWVPPKHAIPFGPFLVAGALEWLYLGAWVVREVPSLRLFG